MKILFIVCLNVCIACVFPFQLKPLFYKVSVHPVPQ